MPTHHSENCGDGAHDDLPESGQSRDDIKALGLPEPIAARREPCGLWTNEPDVASNNSEVVRQLLETGLSEDATRLRHAWIVRILEVSPPQFVEAQ